MGHRLSKIVTRTGDGGTTGLGDGSRMAKDSPRIEAIGAVDELNSTLGLLLSETLPEACASVLTDAQHDLFDLGGELSIPGHVAVTEAHVWRLGAPPTRPPSCLSGPRAPPGRCGGGVCQAGTRRRDRRARSAARGRRRALQRGS